MNKQGLINILMAFILLFVAISIIFIIDRIFFTTQITASMEDINYRYNSFPISEERKLTVQEIIVREARKAGVDENEALRIGLCESTFNPTAKNPNSTARGVFQFIQGTWNNYCEGDVENAEDNIKCFMKYYPIYPSWWSECLKD